MNIIKAYEKGHKVPNISDIFEVNKTTIYRIINNNKNKEEMINEVTQILLNFSVEQINNIIDSMDNRIEALYDNNFGIIDY